MTALKRTLPQPNLTAAEARTRAVAGLYAFKADTLGQSLPAAEKQALAAARLDAANLARRIEANEHVGPVLVEIRGYDLNTKGVKGENDRGLWDDALVLLWIDGAKTTILASIRGNVDPSRHRTGIAFKHGPQHYRVRLGHHRNRLGLRQASPVLIDRDGTGGVEYRIDPARWPYVNIHDDRGWGTGSEGCSTAPPDDFAILFAAARSLGTIDVVLVDEKAFR
ncbi:MAG TPA: hypothetical protein VF594_10955 [Rubricoccaceae bacterium]|jgi:hypothetical protein